MATVKTLTTAVALTTMAASPSFASDTAQPNHGGFLVLVFLGLFAVIVVAQLVPAVVMFLGVVKGVAGAAKKADEEEGTAPAENTEK